VHASSDVDLGGTTTSRRALIALALVVPALLTGCGTAREKATPPGPAATAAVSPGFNSTDVMFVQMIIPHHRQGIAIAEIGAERATRADIKVLASAIVATQRDEVARLEGWLRVWNQPATADPAAHAAHGGMPGTTEKEIAKLRKASPAALDQAFLDMLIAHQDDAVRLARFETAGGENVNALGYARQVDESRSAQIEQMRGYLGK
jgi:uncharacterized protein (DUF305 family)